ncbi:MAG: response regulator [Acidobacteriota bacterium]|nr:response regulator [Acidobacteriota bacterium]
MDDHGFVANASSQSLVLVTYTALPRNPNQAFGKSKTKFAIFSKPAAGRRNSRGLQLSVLVVDDVADVTEMIALFLKHAGYNVSTADSATAALQLARERTFDLIISDIGMPDMDGHQLAESLRTLSDYRSSPIIALTGFPEYDDRGRALQAGFNAHLTKPIEPSQLLGLIHELLK